MNETLQDEEIQSEYHPESEELIKWITGASRVVLFDHSAESHQQSAVEFPVKPKRHLVTEVHVHQTLASAPVRVHRHLPPEPRPIWHPAFDTPLTLALVAVALLSLERKGDTYGSRRNPAHRFNDLKGMTPEEFALIKCFSSAEGASVFTPHTAFMDPSMPEGSPPRESIELRALVFYD
ncbi:hypothetical protein DFH07DRAFT_869641 [Mycena maculata]|uniref:Uncharacterized protein n=1 Tax=Mycena maculata TaxID=230809 RepID=A0AAD7ILD4_9AGAR|nr:hypothetical protein DFH07DRAFT_869641 [Mycena maculata]